MAKMQNLYYGKKYNFNKTGDGSLFCGVALPTPNCIRIAKRHSRMAVPFFVRLSFFLNGGRQPVARLLYCPAMDDNPRFYRGK